MKRTRVAMVTVPLFGSSGVIEGEDGTRWPYIELGEHTCVLPICATAGSVRIGLIRELKPILEEVRTKVPSDFRRGEPDNEVVAREILVRKTGIEQGDILHIVPFNFQTPGWPPNVVFDKSKRWLAWTRSQCGRKVSWFDLGEIQAMLTASDTPIKDAPTWHLLAWIVMQYDQGSLPGEP